MVCFYFHNIKQVDWDLIPGTGPSLSQEQMIWDVSNNISCIRNFSHHFIMTLIITYHRVSFILIEADNLIDN